MFVAVVERNAEGRVSVDRYPLLASSIDEAKAMAEKILNWSKYWNKAALVKYGACAAEFRIKAILDSKETEG